MRPEKKKRIATAASGEPLAAMGAAFSKLTLPELPAAPAQPPPPTPAPTKPLWKMGRVILRKETAHRAGKTVIVVHDFASHLPASIIEKVAKNLRAGCGCGGSVKERTIEIQGDQVGRIRELLEKEGFEVAGVR